MALPPTQVRMLVLLCDGRSHGREELHACLCDDLGELSNIRAHLTHLRKALRPLGQEIICEKIGGAITYRLVLYWLPIRSSTPSLPLHPLLPSSQKSL